MASIETIEKVMVQQIKSELNSQYTEINEQYYDFLNNDFAK